MFTLEILVQCGKIGLLFIYFLGFFFCRHAKIMNINEVFTNKCASLQNVVVPLVVVCYKV